MSDRPVLAGALGALVIAFSAILVRLAEVSPSTAAFFRCSYALPLLALLAWREHERYGGRSRRDHLLGFFAGVLFAANLIFWHHAIEAVGAGLSTVLGNVQVVFVALLAWAALGERPDNRSLVAVPVVFGGVVLISGVIGSGAYGDDPQLGVAFGLAAAGMCALFLLILRNINADIRRSIPYRSPNRRHSGASMATPAGPSAPAVVGTAENAKMSHGTSAGHAADDTGT